MFCTAVAGACIGFLWFNAHPAQVFMGDTGSLAIGGVLGAVAVLLKAEGAPEGLAVARMWSAEERRLEGGAEATGAFQRAQVPFQWVRTPSQRG